MNWTATSNGQLKFEFTSRDDFISFLNTMIVETAAKYGYKLTLEPLPKDDIKVVRA
jgi:hypothetical protein